MGLLMGRLEQWAGMCQSWMNGNIALISGDSEKSSKKSISRTYFFLRVYCVAYPIKLLLIKHGSL